MKRMLGRCIPALLLEVSPELPEPRPNANRKKVTGLGTPPRWRGRKGPEKEKKDKVEFSDE